MKSELEEQNCDLRKIFLWRNGKGKSAPCGVRTPDLKLLGIGNTTVPTLKLMVIAPLFHMEGPKLKPVTLAYSDIFNIDSDALWGAFTVIEIRVVEVMGRLSHLQEFYNEDTYQYVQMHGMDVALSRLISEPLLPSRNRQNTALSLPMYSTSLRHRDIGLC
ncbi:hypothetical protein VNO77_19747 [Canavalia gladiata]|uniref:Uncharacterized protein n=1 Tax=Canavalia gladiata TaxID=3824 RepID=A0AAN9LRV5_CANGL